MNTDLRKKEKMILRKIFSKFMNKAFSQKLWKM